MRGIVRGLAGYQEEAKAIATQLVERECGALECLGIDRASPEKGLWSVSFQVLSPRGTKVDGPLLVIVSETTGEALFFDEWFHQRRKPT